MRYVFNVDELCNELRNIYSNKVVEEDVSKIAAALASYARSARSAAIEDWSDDKAADMLHRVAVACEELARFTSPN